MKIKLLVIALGIIIIAGLGSWGVSMKQKITDTIPPNPSPTAEFGNAVTLDIGDVVAYSDGLTVSLKGIDDSRCKPDVQCIWAGELAAVLEAKRGAFASMTEIRLGTARNHNVISNGYSFMLDSATEKTATITVTKNPAPRDDKDFVVCTQEAKLCPDGSYVGRTGPKCEFAPCGSMKR